MWTSAHTSQALAVFDTAARGQSRLAVAVRLSMLAFCGVALGPSAARAVPCSDVPNAVYVAVPPSAEQYVEKIAQKLQLDDAKPLPIIWQTTTSCRAVEAVARDSTPGVCAPGACLTGKAKVWPLDRTPVKTCDLAATGTHIDLALSDVFPSSCPAFAVTPATGIVDVLGPVSPYALVMNPAATEGAMQAEEAHFVFGAGQAAGVKPWLNDNAVYWLGDRDAGALLLSARSKLPIGRFRTGKVVATPDDVFAGLQTDAAAALGILPTVLTDPRRSEVRVLGFQAIGQHGAFFPDRKSTTFEKQNVRDGHYALWGYLHMIMRADPGDPKRPQSASAARVADILTGRVQVAMQDTLPMQVTQGFVPQCAMRVGRTSDSAALTPMAPTESCHCWFEKNVKNGLLSCGECKDGVTCAIGKCRRNLCEVD